METENPRELIHAADVSQRAAAARDLARIGTLDDLDVLLDYATTHKSTAVRLVTAAAAADILHRHRGLRGAPGLPDDLRAALHKRLGSVDPIHNPSLLMCWSALADSRAIERLGRMLRDPRGPVRAGALVALRRLALSGAAFSLVALPEAAAGWVADRRMLPDVLADLVRLVGEAGWPGFEPLFEGAKARGPAAAKAVAEARSRLASRADPARWAGLWVGEGLDVFENGPPAETPGWWLIHAGSVWGPDGPSEARFEATGLVLGGQSTRLVWAGRTGRPGLSLALQTAAGETCWRLDGDALAIAVPERQADWAGLPKAAVLGVIDWLDAATAPDPVEAEPEGEPDEPDVERVVVARPKKDESERRDLAVALLRWRAGDRAGALEGLAALTAGKRPMADAWWWTAKLLSEAPKEKKRAKAALTEALALSKNSTPWRAEAEALLTTLG